MKVDVVQEGSGFRYQLKPEKNDRAIGHTAFPSIGAEPLKLVNTEYRVDLPPLFRQIHPDSHALAIWYAIYPFIGHELSLPFGVSSWLAETLYAKAGLVLPNVDPALKRRAAAAKGKGILAYSGGLDSTVARLVLPREVSGVMLDRMAEMSGEHPSSGSFTDPLETRMMARRIQRDGYPLFFVHENHERLWEPYPKWHSEMGILSVIYMADSLDASFVENGNVLCVYGWRGYHDNQADSWAFRPPEYPLVPVGACLPADRTSRDAEASQSCPVVIPPTSLMGLSFSNCCAGMSEVVTSTLLHHSPYRRLTASCYCHTAPNQPYGSYCLQCDKCFRKLLLDFIIADEDVPPSLIDQFLGVPSMRSIFGQPYLDWHHCWFYIFQKIKCSHPFIATMQKQAVRGPDLSVLEKWYPPAAVAIDSEHREFVVQRVLETVEPMSDEDVTYLASLNLPALHAPPLTGSILADPKHSDLSTPAPPPEATPATEPRIRGTSDVNVVPEESLARDKTRVLLLETESTERHRHHGAEIFPFVSGFLREQGLSVLWWRVRVPAEYMHIGTRFSVDLPPKGKGALFRNLKRWVPDVVCFNNKPTEALRQQVSVAANGAHVVDVSGSRPNTVTAHQILQLLAIGKEKFALPVREGDLLFEVASPRYERLSLNVETEREIQPVRLFGWGQCAYQRSTARNRFYRQVESSLVQNHVGCSFCTLANDSEQVGAADARQVRKSPLEFVVEQVLAHQESAGENSDLFEYIVDDNSFSSYYADFFRRVHELPIRPATFFGWLRADQLLGSRTELEELLPRLQRSGHRFRILSIGAENFSPDENERLNKGLRNDQIWACFDMIQDLETRFPDTFGCPDLGYFSAILFTPWTQPDDLRQNFIAAQRLGEDWLMRAMGTRLQLRAGTAIAELARHDGLTAETHESVGEIAAICLTNPDEQEIPWRFTNPETALIHRLLTRLEPIPVTASIPEDDPLLLDIERLRAELAADISTDYVELATAILEAVVVVGAEASVHGIFAQVARAHADRL